eukprot:1160293-Pelagomonas_calceolata.AAC.4
MCTACAFYRLEKGIEKGKGRGEQDTGPRLATCSLYGAPQAGHDIAAVAAAVAAVEGERRQWVFAFVPADVPGQSLAAKAVAGGGAGFEHSSSQLPGIPRHTTVLDLGTKRQSVSMKRALIAYMETVLQKAALDTKAAFEQDCTARGCACREALYI